MPRGGIYDAVTSHKQLLTRQVLSQWRFPIHFLAASYAKNDLQIKKLG